VIDAENISIATRQGSSIFRVNPFIIKSILPHHFLYQILYISCVPFLDDRKVHLHILTKCPHFLSEPVVFGSIFYGADQQALGKDLILDKELL
jgi:hypothetical protein